MGSAFPLEVRPASVFAQRGEPLAMQARITYYEIYEERKRETSGKETGKASPFCQRGRRRHNGAHDE
jgi:hypothetical protein